MLRISFAATQFASIINNITNASIADREGGTGVVDKGQSLSAVTQDVDCESRPKGSGYDIGADEK